MAQLPPLPVNQTYDVNRPKERSILRGSMLATVSKLTTAAKRVLLGRPFRSDALGHTLLPKRIALPVFASDAMSSVAYAPEEIFLVLSAAGISAYVYAPWSGSAMRSP